jgi:hypothetical protein
MRARRRGDQDGSQNGLYPANSLTPASSGRARPALLTSASIVALATIGLPGLAQAACTPALQTISGPVTGPVVSNGGAINVTGAGDLSGGPDGVDALTCAITALTNQQGGTISGGAGGLSAAGGAGVSNAVTITTLANFGKISGGTGGAASRTGPAGGAGVSNAGTITNLTNGGEIDGGTGGTGALAGAGDAGVSTTGAMRILFNGGAIVGGTGGLGDTGGVGGAGLSNAGTSER